MPVNHYFNHYSPVKTTQQDLVEHAINEVIQIMGHDIYYMPRESWSEEPDSIFGEDISSKFASAYKVEMYVNTTDFFEGQGDFFSKFGLEIRDNSTFIVAARAFKKNVSSDVRSVPKEGDLLYVPFQRKIYEIRFVEQNKPFFTLGKKTPYAYELRCEAYRYSHEDIDTGVEEIDFLEKHIAFTVAMTMIAPGGGDYNIGEIVYTGTVSNQTAYGEVSDWQPTTKVIKVINTYGEFLANTVLRGATSNTAWTIQTMTDRGNYTKYEQSDALELQEQANSIIDTTETNPFGMT